MPVNDTTTNQGYQKPNIANQLSDDVGRLRSALDSIDTDMAARLAKAGGVMTGALGVTAGTAGAPSVYFTGDTNTGLYLPGADQVAISTGGTGRLFVSSNGTVTTSASIAPGGGLATWNAGLNLFSPGGGVGQIAASTDASGTAGTLVFQTGTERLRITSDGKVGIGTSSPSALLHLDLGGASSSTQGPEIRLSRASLSGASLTPGDVLNAIKFQTNATTRYYSIEQRSGSLTTTSSLHVAFENDSGKTTRLTLDEAGRLLVGTSSATNNIRLDQSFAIVTTGSKYGGASLTTYGGTISGYCPVLDFQRSRGTTDGSFTKAESGDALGAVVFRGSDGSAWAPAAAIEGFVDAATGSGDMPGRLVFSTTADGASSPTERLRISNDGAVKIAGDNFQIATSKTPASATATGTTGQIAWDASYIYVCTATDTWKRAALSTW